jgi:hypothetical protein
MNMATPPYQPWSSLQNNPLGFDDPWSLIYLECHKLHDRLAFTNPDICYLVGNVCHRRNLPGRLPDDLRRTYVSDVASYQTYDSQCQRVW